MSTLVKLPFSVTHWQCMCAPKNGPSRNGVRQLGKNWMEWKRDPTLSQYNYCTVVFLKLESVCSPQEPVRQLEEVERKIKTVYN